LTPTAIGAIRQVRLALADGGDLANVERRRDLERERTSVGDPRDVTATSRFHVVPVKVVGATTSVRFSMTCTGVPGTTTPLMTLKFRVQLMLVYVTLPALLPACTHRLPLHPST